MQVQKIPISKLMPNENQPRHRFKRGSIQTLSDSMKAMGQETALKVRFLTEGEKASYLKSEIEWHEAGGEKPEKTIGERGFEHLVVGGHRRLEAAKMAGFEALDCIVLDITPEQTHIASLMDNNIEEMDWWDWDLAIEAEHKTFPNMPQRELAQRLGVSKSKVNNALVLAKALDETARMVIEMNLNPNNWDSQGRLIPDGDNDSEDEDDLVQLLDKDPQTKGSRVQPLDKPKPKYRITESILLVSAGLEDPEMMADTVEFSIYYQLNEALAKKMVEWVDDGGEPQYFDPKKASNGKNMGEDPLAEAWKGLGPNFKVKYKGGEDYEIHLAVTGEQKVLETVRATQFALEGGLTAKLAGFLKGLST
jgi:ParB-like chromosome segregation protein Spo0J